MKRKLSKSFLFGSLFGLVSFAYGSGGSLIQILDPKLFDAGIGCSVRPQEEGRGYRAVFVDLNAEGLDGPWMKIDGKVVKLTQVTGSWPFNKNQKSDLKFVGIDDVNVAFQVVNTASGSAGFNFKGILTVSAGTKKQVMEISGNCGD